MLLEILYVTNWLKKLMLLIQTDKSLFKIAKLDIPETGIDHVYRIESIIYSFRK